MIEDLKAILQRFTSIEGVILAMVVGTDGLVIESTGGRDYDIDAVAAVATTGLGASQVLAEEVTQGRLIQSMIEFEQGLVILEPIAELGILLILTDTASNIGRVRLVTRRERETLERALSS